jgi:HEAT repeat protein
MGTVIRYHMAQDEHTAVLMTERLGESKSPLTVDELLEAVADPRFHVRFEAIISIARTLPDERLIEALVKILQGPEPALSVVAAWALGRLGDRRALEPLRQALDADYRSVQAHSSRALGALGDTAVVSLLIERLNNEKDYGLCLAYASALGQLQASEAITTLFPLLHQSEDEASRLEIALALARIVGNEHGFIQLMRQIRAERGTATAQALTAMQKRISGLGAGGLTAVLEQCVNALARDEVEDGVILLLQLVELIPSEQFSQPAQLVLKECASHLSQNGASRVEYLLLTLCILQISLS